MSGGSTTSNTTSNQINQIPQWMSDAGQQNYAYAQDVAQQPLQQYQGQMVADVSDQTQQSWDTAANSGNVGADQYNAATAGYLNAQNYTPTNIDAQGYNSTDYNATGYNSRDYNATGYNAAQTGSSNLGQYMNPYTSSVINATLPIMQQQLGLNQNAQQNAASSANAFGGSRQGIQQGVTQAQGAMDMTQMAAQLNNANYNQARQASEFDVGAQNQAQQFSAGAYNTAAAANAAAANTASQWNAGAYNTAAAANAAATNTANQFNAGQANDISKANQSAQQAAVNSAIQASYGLTNTGDSMNKANVANYNMQQSAGASQSMQAQNQINAQMAKFNQASNYSQQQLGVLESALGMTPHDTSTSGQSNTTTTTPTDWASLISGGAKTAAGVWQASDRSMKTDITKLGKDPKTGLDMHAYRYKGDPKSYPKVVGPMAQEVQEKYPDDVAKVGSKGKLAIKGYAGGTSYVPPSLAAFTPPSSPGVAKGIGALSAFRPPVRMPRGAGVPKMQRFAFGTEDVQAPNMDDADLGDQIMGGDTFKDNTADRIGDIGEGLSQMAGARSPKKAASGSPQMPAGWGAPSMGYFRTGYAEGTPFVLPQSTNAPVPPAMTGALGSLQTPPGGWVGGQPPNNNDTGLLPRSNNAPVPPAMTGALGSLQTPPGGWAGGQPPNNDVGLLYPRSNNAPTPPQGYAGGVPRVPGFGSTDTVPSMLTPGEAVLTPRAAQHIGRDKIAALNAMLPPVRDQATASPRAGARGIAGALANTKRRPRVAGGLSG